MIEIFKTLDGSTGLYNKDLDEVYHSKYGAVTEAMEKFINPCLKLNNKPLKILDICYGIGYNTKCALKTFKNIELIDCVEIDKNLVEMSCSFDFDDNINKTIKDNLESSKFIRFYIDDIRKVIVNLNKKYDIIFHDGFAPHKQSEIWSENLIKKILEHLSYSGMYVTYNHSKVVLGALNTTGIFIGKTLKNGKCIGTVASYDKNLIQNPLNEFELGELQTKSAITYKDENLNLTHTEINKNREIELKTSTRPTLSFYKKRFKLLSN